MRGSRRHSTRSGRRRAGLRTAGRVTPRAALRLSLSALVAIVVVAAGPAAQAGGKRELSVMTQNLYLGSSLTPALAAQSGQEFVAAVAQIYGTAIATDFPSRATAIAATIAAERPDLVALQEVSRWATQATAPGAHPPGLDFLEILRGRLAARGLHYEVAAVSDNAAIGPVPLVSPAHGCVTAAPVPGCTVSLYDRDVILVNADTPELDWADPRSGDYTAQQSFQPPIGPPVSFARGWASIDGTFQGKRFRFVDTHLEVQNAPAVQEAQAREFLAGPAAAPGAVIAAGDFNSAADGTTTTSYALLTKSWFVDAWPAANPCRPGLTCCQNPTLTNPTSQLDSRIDFVFTHGPVTAATAHVVGATPFQTTAPLWASDHAGVIAALHLC